MVTYYSKYYKWGKENYYERKFKVIGIIIICIVLFGVLFFFRYSFRSERPSELCKEMKEISYKQILIGLSKEEVEGILGEPGYKFDNETGDVYAYNAGTLDTGIFLEILLFFLVVAIIVN